MRMKKDGSGQPEVVAQMVEFYGPLEADAQFVYLGRSGGGLYRAPAGAGESTKFVNVAVVDFVVTADRVWALEDNGYRFSEEEKKKPNRLLAVTK